MNSHVSSSSSVKPIFIAARRLADLNERQAYVKQACGDNSELQRQVENLLAALPQSSSSPLDRAVEKLGPAQIVALDAAPDAAIDIASHPMIGPYKLLEQLGEGGMGTVYMAEQKQPVKRRVALKVIKPGMDSKEVIARFEAERQALAMMDHSNIARIFDGGLTEQGRPYFVMELVRGLSIDEYCDDAKLSLRDRLRLFTDVCRAVQHAHQKGIIHRDLKPSNILITLHDGVPVVKVIDFGIARALDHDLTDRTLFTRFAELIGTPVYMSPEQAEMSGLDVDTRSDVYSLGVMLYKVLVGVTPFDERTLKRAGLDEMRRIIREDEPFRPSRRISTLGNELASTISCRRGTDSRELSLSMQRELDWIVMKALEKNRDRRYESASALAADILRFLNDDPVEACPPSLVYRAKKSLRRNRLMITVASVISLALIVSSAVSVWQVIRVGRAHRASLAREQQTNDLLEATRLQSAIDAFRNYDLVRLQELTAPITIGRGPSPAESGSFHRLLRNVARPVPVRSFIHTAAVHDIAVAADGGRFVSVDAKGAVRLWNLTDGVSSPLLGSHHEQTDAVALSPDGNRAVTGSGTGQVWFWNLDGGDAGPHLSPLTTGVEALAWSPDGSYVAAGARYSETLVCDSGGRQLFRIKNDHRHETLLFSPDSTQLFVPTREGIDIWDLTSRQRQTSVSTYPLNNVRAMCWAGPQREWLVAGDRYTESLVIFDRRTGDRLGIVDTGADYAQCIAASSDGRWLTAVYGDGRVQVCQLTESVTGEVTGKVWLQFSAHQSEEARATAAWIGDSLRFVTAGKDGRVHLWDLNEILPARVLDPPTPLLAAFPVGANELIYYFHSRREYGMGHGDRPFRVNYSGKPTSPPGDVSPHPLHSFARQQVGGLIAVVRAGKIRIVALESGNVLDRIDSPITLDGFLVLSPDAKAVVATSLDGQMCLWRTSDDWATHEMLCRLRVSTTTVPIFADAGRTLIADNDRNEIFEWDIATGETIRTREISIGAARAASHRGSLLATTTDGVIRVRDRATGDVLLQSANLSVATALKFLQDDRVLISAHEDETIRAWHVATGVSLGVVHKPAQPLGRPEALTLAEDGSRLLVWYRNAGALRPVILGVAFQSAAASVPRTFLPELQIMSNAGDLAVTPSVIEGETIRIPVVLSPATHEIVTLNFETVTDTAGAADFTGKSGTLTFMPFQTVKEIHVGTLVHGAEDSIVERDETFQVRISDAVNATIARQQATVRIIDDDSTR